MEPLLQIEHYSISFRQYQRGLWQREFTAVSDLNLKVYPGELVAVVGASGSGKSLLAHGLLGILPYNAYAKGTLRYEGKPLTRKRIQALRGREIVLIPQSASFLDPLMKVGRQIPRGSRKAEADRMRQMFRQYRLEQEVEEKYPFELSGGMTRRVLLTAARMEEPKLVIADEPTPGLHKELAVLALGHLQEMARQGAGVLLITHELEQALAVADRIVVFWDGKSIEERSAGDFKREENLTHPYTRALWRAMPRNGFQCETETEILKSEAETEILESETGKKEGYPQGSLEARELSFSYGQGSKNVLESLNLTVKSGEVVGLMAPSGFGKTTLCKILAGYEKPCQGTVLMDGMPLLPKRGYAPVQMIWQHAILALDPKMRMKESLEEGGPVSEEIIKGLGIRKEWMNRFPVELSGGELQRFCIARALGPGTRFLLADEMTAMLDLISQCQIWKFLLTEAKERGIGILAVSHDQELLEQVCTRIETL